jgi:hypothetical protein
MAVRPVQNMERKAVQAGGECTQNRQRRRDSEVLANEREWGYSCSRFDPGVAFILQAEAVLRGHGVAQEMTLLRLEVN